MEPSKQDVSRRQFLSIAIGAIGGLISAVIGVPAIAYIVGPVLQKQTVDWLKLGSVQKVEPGNPTLFKTSVEHQTGWVTSQEEVAAYVLTEDGQHYLAISNICTHLGCRVRWIPEQGEFFCPCHNAVFGKDGAVVSGPPPRPLDQFETKVENGILFIKRG